MSSSFGISGFGIIVLLVVPVTLLIVMLVMLIRGNTGTRWVGGIGLLLFLLIVPAMFYMSLAETREMVLAEQQLAELQMRDARTAEVEQRRLVYQSGKDHAGNAWRHASEHYLQADHYPSAAAAVRGLVVQLEPLLEAAVPAGGKVHHVEFATTERVDASVAEAAAQLLAERDPKLYVTTESASRGAGGASPSRQEAPPTVRVLLEMRGSYSLQNQVDTFEGKFLEAQVSGPGGSFTRSAAVVPKPWVDDYNAFVSRKGGEYMLAQSTEPAMDPNEAHTLAIQDAAQQLTVHAQARLLGENRYGSINATRLHEQILAALHVGRFVEDRFVQAFDRPGGKIYQAWLLIQPEPAVLEQMARAQFTQSRQQKAHYVSTALGAVVMLVVVVVIYWFLNLVTRGYYVTGLKLAAAMVLMVGLVLLAMVS